MSRCMIVLLFCVAGVEAQEARTGFDLAATVSGGAFYSHQLASGPVNGGLRSVLYPTLKLSDRWSASASLQIASSPYFYEQFSNPKREVSASLLQGHVAYTRFSGNRSFSFRAGQLSSAFGSFFLRYDDAVNPLIDMPMAYGYYYKSVTTRGLPGVQIDATAGKFDVRGQFTNSSPANPRTMLQSDQYGSYTAGGGYTIRQGFRVGASFNRGAYLHRQHAFYFPGEARPHDLQATSFGVDVQYGISTANGSITIAITGRFRCSSTKPAMRRSGVWCIRGCTLRPVSITSVRMPIRGASWWNSRLDSGRTAISC
jgi:hypothetical protein